MMNLPLIPAEIRCSHLGSRPNLDGTPGDCPPYECRGGFAQCSPLYADPSGATLPKCPKFHNRAVSIGKAKTALPVLTGKCFYLGDATGGEVLCGSCTNKTMLFTFACSNKEASPSGTCVTPTMRKTVPSGVGCCKGCPEFTTEVPFVSETIIDPKPRSDPREAFNASMVRFNGNLYMTYRTGQGGCQIHVCQMSEDLTPGKSALLNLNHPLCRSSREDPRLFVHRGKLHVTFVGVVGDPVNGKGNTHVLYAELREDLAVEKVWHPKYQFANPTWEKSHSYFSWQDELFAVYSISPHVVLHVNGDTALPFSEHKTKMLWSGGHLRGGASPIRVGDEYWSWFHGSVEQGQATPSGPAGTKVYNIGVYAFEAKPPFRPTRITPNPVLWADEKTRLPAWCAVTFPNGAVLDGERWRVSCGIHDREIRVYEWNHKDIEKVMVKV